jgi:hypothetical protein
VVGTNTARLTLYKPDPNDNVDVNQDINANYDKVDLLGKKAEPITNPFVKRNTSDVINSATQSVLETLTVVLKTNHWYEIIAGFRYSTSVVVGNNPMASSELKFKLGGSVAITDPPLARATMINCATGPIRQTYGTTFDVPADGTYTFGNCVDSGGAGNTITILASGGTDNTGFDRCMWIKDLGEK